MKKTFFPQYELAESLTKIRKKAERSGQSVRKPKVFDCSTCGLDKGCRIPYMPGAGPKPAKVMIVGEAPGAVEDIKGIPFVGETGTILRDTLRLYGINPEDCFITNSCRCRPPENETPTSKQILSCFSKLEQEIFEVQPKIILLCGAVPLEAVLGESGITKYRGWQIPYKKYNTIILPTFHPSHVNRDLLANMPCLMADIQKLLKFKPFEDYDVNDYESNHEVLTSVYDIENKILKRVRNGEPYVFDIETVGGNKDNPKNGVKPFYNNSRILICGVSFDGRNSYSFNITDDTIPAFTELYTSKTKKICHNFKFEQIWGMIKYNIPEVDLDTTDDTMLLSYILDERKGIHSLAFQSFVRLGVHKLTGVEEYVKKMDECPPDLMHRYCGVDCKNTYKIWEIYQQEIENYPELFNVYRHILMEGTLAINRMETEGVIINWDRVAKIDYDVDEKGREQGYSIIIGNIAKNLYTLPKITQFKRKYGRVINPKSPKDVVTYIIDNYGIEWLGRTKKENLSADAAVLKALAEDGDRFCQLLLEFRDMVKAQSTYIKGLVGYKYDDDKLHAEYNMHGTETGRLSSNSPNLQNIDKHKHKEVRTVFIPPKDHVIMSFDYSAAEICGIAMASNDSMLVKEIKEGVNIHGKWAKIIFDIEGNVDWHNETFKDLRFKTKNRFFFPSCYGAHYLSISESIGLPKHKMQLVQKRFFEEYNGLRQYQENVVNEYKNNGYITTFFGRRRRAPLSYTQIINTPIQSIMGDFTTLSLIALSRRGYRIPLDVHDDLTFYIHYDKIKESYKEVRDVMIGWDFPFINVPLEIECSIGEDNWGELKEYKP